MAIVEAIIALFLLMIGGFVAALLIFFIKKIVNKKI